MLNEAFKSIFYTGLYASVLIAVIIVIRMITKKRCNRVLCFLWMLVAIRLLCPFSLKKVIQTPDFLERNTEPGYQLAESIKNNSGKMTEMTPWEEYYMPAEANQPSVFYRVLNVVRRDGAIVWIIGMLGILTYHFATAVALRRKLSVCVREKDAFVCDCITVPFVFGVIRPRIFLPSDIDGTWKEDAIAHERIHIKNKDYIWRPLFAFLVSVYWFNPLIWLAFDLFCRDLELHCDDEATAGLSAEEKIRGIHALFCGFQQAYPGNVSDRFLQRNHKRKSQEYSSGRKTRRKNQNYYCSCWDSSIGDYVFVWSIAHHGEYGTSFRRRRFGGQFNCALSEGVLLLAVA